jgi:hypothetical protein
MGTAGRPTPLLTLPDSLLVHLFNLLAPAERQHIIPLVCRRLRVLANTASSLWEQVHLALPHDFQHTISTAHLYQFFVRREGAVRSLHVEMSSGAAWPTVVAVLGVVGRSLHDLRIAGDTQECQVAGCTAPWLELVPNLLSLELDEAVDHSIAEARFPQSELVVLTMTSWLLASCLQTGVGGRRGLLVATTCSPPLRADAPLQLGPASLLPFTPLPPRLPCLQASPGWSSATAEMRACTLCLQTLSEQCSSEKLEAALQMPPCSGCRLQDAASISSPSFFKQ